MKFPQGSPGLDVSPWGMDLTSVSDRSATSRYRSPASSAPRVGGARDRQGHADGESLDLEQDLVFASGRRCQVAVHSQTRAVHTSREPFSRSCTIFSLASLTTAAVSARARGSGI